MDKYKFTIPKSIVILIILVTVLSILRIVLFNKFSQVYLFWNIFLAIIPFCISSILLWWARNHKLKKYLFFIGGILWLLFIPNAPYIITDLIHIGEVRAVPALYDSFLIFNSAWVGLLFGLHSIYHMEQILREKYSARVTFAILTITMLFISFGIYLGRFLRFNSWDIFEKPLSFINGIGEIFSNKTDSIEAFLYTGLFLFFIIMSYNSWRATQIKL
ncbi:MAG: DUF1361 domain-containing protein [Candidatus Paceibacterota bacterium]|jgi:uncharacterized membrane protein